MADIKNKKANISQEVKKEYRHSDRVEVGDWVRVTDENGKYFDGLVSYENNSWREIFTDPDYVVVSFHDHKFTKI